MKKIVIPEYEWGPSVVAEKKALTVQHYVHNKITDTDEELYSLQQTFCRLMQVLANKGLLTAPEVQNIVHGMNGSILPEYAD